MRFFVFILFMVCVRTYPSPGLLADAKKSLIDAQAVNAYDQAVRQNLDELKRYDEFVIGIFFVSYLFFNSRPHFFS